MFDSEPLCLSTQFVIFLSLKTLLKHVVSALFLLNSERLLSNEEFGRVEFPMLESASHVRVLDSWFLEA